MSLLRIWVNLKHENRVMRETLQKLGKTYSQQRRSHDVTT